MPPVVSELDVEVMHLLGTTPRYKERGGGLGREGGVKVWHRDHAFARRFRAQRRVNSCFGLLFDRLSGNYGKGGLRRFLT